MRTHAAAVLSLSFLLSACRPEYWCQRPDESRLSPGQRALLPRVDDAASRCRAQLRDRSELDEAGCFGDLTAAVEGFLAEPKGLNGPDAEAFIAGHLAWLVAQAGSDYPTPKLRRRAAARALKAYRENVLRRHPEAAKYLK